MNRTASIRCNVCCNIHSIICVLSTRCLGAMVIRHMYHVNLTFQSRPSPISRYYLGRQIINFYRFGSEITPSRCKRWCVETHRRSTIFIQELISTNSVPVRQIRTNVLSKTKGLIYSKQVWDTFRYGKMYLHICARSRHASDNVCLVWVYFFYSLSCCSMSARARVKIINEHFQEICTSSSDYDQTRLKATYKLEMVCSSTVFVSPL